LRSGGEDHKTARPPTLASTLPSGPGKINRGRVDSAGLGVETMPRAAAESRQEHGKTALPPAAHHRHGAGRERRLLGSIYCAANFGGSITAILINTPGDPSASATAYDGYPMAKKGEAGRALGMSTVASALGGIFSVVVMIVAAPLLARAAYNFGPPEYFALALFGLSMLGAVGAEAGIRNLIAGAFGVLLATIGLDLTTSVERFTFGLPELSEGIGIVPVLTGLFAMSEMLVQASQLHVVPERLALDAVRLPSLADFRKCAKAISMSSVLGTFIGILPALGATTAALISYSETKRWSRHKEEFGKGAIEGVAGPEAANNAAVGGSMVPTLALGIPGSTTTAIILAALLVQGVRPGPHLFNEQPTLLWAVFSSMLASHLIYLVLGLFAAKLFARMAPARSRSGGRRSRRRRAP
jgi:putative tricarboxylic transport membrane protein